MYKCVSDNSEMMISYFIQNWQPNNYFYIILYKIDSAQSSVQNDFLFELSTLMKPTPKLNNCT